MLVRQSGNGWDMDKDLLRVARRVFEEAQKRRLDYLTTTENSLREIQSIRPDVTASEAMSALNAVRRSS